MCFIHTFYSKVARGDNCQDNLSLDLFVKTRISCPLTLSYCKIGFGSGRKFGLTEASEKRDHKMADHFSYIAISFFLKVGLPSLDSIFSAHNGSN